jgi:hypothetical protein
MPDYCNFQNNEQTCVVCGFRSRHANAIRLCRKQGDAPALATQSPTHGPGTELSKLLKRFGIEPTPTCQCRAKQQQMDQWGCDECERPERIDEVVAVMRAEAEARGLPFLDVAGRLLVRRAISNARRNA